MKIIETIDNEYGAFLIFFRKNSRYGIRYINPAFTPNAGKYKDKYYKSKKEAENQWDELLNYHQCL